MYYATVSGKRALIAYKVFFFFFFFAAAGENYKVRDDHLRLGHRFSIYKRILAFRQNPFTYSKWSIKLLKRERVRHFSMPK